MKKIILSLISLMVLPFSNQLNATKMPDVITFISDSGGKYIAHRGENNFLAAFFYLRFIDKLGNRKSDISKHTKKYQEQEIRHLNVCLENIGDAIAKIKTVLTYDNQIGFLEEEIAEVAEDEDFDLGDLNGVIQQFHPVKAFGLKCKILKGLLFAGGVALVAYLAVRNVFMQTELDELKDGFLVEQEHVKELEGNLQAAIASIKAEQVLVKPAIEQLDNRMDGFRVEQEHVKVLEGNLQAAIASIKAEQVLVKSAIEQLDNRVEKQMEGLESDLGDARREQDQARAERAAMNEDTRIIGQALGKNCYDNDFDYYYRKYDQPCEGLIGVLRKKY